MKTPIQRMTPAQQNITMEIIDDKIEMMIEKIKCHQASPHHTMQDLKMLQRENAKMMNDLSK